MTYSSEILPKDKFLEIEVDRVLKLHDALINKYGGLSGVRDAGLLDICLNSCFAQFGETEFYPAVLEKSLKLQFQLFSIIRFVMEINALDVF